MEWSGKLSRSISCSMVFFCKYECYCAIQFFFELLTWKSRGDNFSHSFYLFYYLKNCWKHISNDDTNSFEQLSHAHFIVIFYYHITPHNKNHQSFHYSCFHFACSSSKLCHVIIIIIIITFGQFLLTKKYIISLSHISHLSLCVY